MPRLYRPSIPVEVRLRVVLRQLGEMWPDEVIRIHREARSSMAKALGERLEKLATLLGCTAKDLRLDHDPALENRTIRNITICFKGNGHRQITEYDPPANDPDSLRYRPHGAQFDGSHDVKTRIRGEHGQFADNVIAKRERRRLKKIASKKDAKVRPGKRKSTIQNANRWPPKGSRKLRNRK